MTNEAKQSKAQGHDTSQPCDVLGRIQRALSTRHEYKHITHQRAAELADILAPDDDDTIIFALIELLHGILAASMSEEHVENDVEGKVMHATHRAYVKTIHFQEAHNEFARLNPDNERDRRVIMREFIDREGGAS